MLVEAQELTLVDLDQNRSAQVLEQLRSGETNVLIAPTAATPGTAATVTQMTDDAIELTVECGTNSLDTVHARSECWVRVATGREHYCFDATVLSADRTGEALRLCVRRPLRVSLRQRRRFWRTPVRESTTVELSTEREAWRCKGAMLNVSQAGLACRVDQADAEQLCIGDTVHATFRLDGEAADFSVDGVLKGKTPTSDSVRVILRLEFRWMNDTDARDRIDRATRPPAGTG